MLNTKEYYKKITKEKRNYSVLLKNFIQAFTSGGVIAIIGQSLIDIYRNIADEKQAILYMTMTIIITAGILTAVGIYDNLGQMCKCGLAIPITGEASRGDTHFLISIYKYMYIKDCKNIGRIRCKSEKINSKVVFLAMIEQNWGEILKKADETPYELKSI